MKTAKLLIIALGAAGLFAATAPAFAQDRFTQEEAERRLQRIERDLREVRSIVLQAKESGQPVEVRTASSDDQIATLQTKLDDIEQSVRGLTGQIEALSHDQEQAKKDSAATQAQIASLSDRLDKLEKQGVAAQAPAPQASSDGTLGGQAQAGGNPSADANGAFVEARQLLLNGDYPAAGTAFQSFIDTYGSSPSVPAAHYWLGEVKYTLGDYQSAAANFVVSFRAWPKTSWAPEAMVKLAMSLVKLNKPAEACETLGALDRRYPKAAGAHADAAAVRVKAHCTG